MTLEPGSVTEVCYVTHDIEAMARRWSAVARAGPFFMMQVPDMPRLYRGRMSDDRFTAALGFSGTTLVEFIQPLDDKPSLFREVLDVKGDGAVHHIMPNIRPGGAEGYDALCKSYEDQGLERVLDFTNPGGGRNCFYDGRAQVGVFIEVLEVGPATYDFLGRMYDAHCRDGGTRALGDLADLRN